VLQRAESRLSTGERDVAALLGDLQTREAKLAEREEKVEFDSSRAAARLERIEERDLALREAERSLERRAREDARRLLLEGRYFDPAINGSLSFVVNSAGGVTIDPLTGTPLTLGADVNGSLAAAGQVDHGNLRFSI